MVFLGVLGLSCSLTAQYFAARSAMGFGTALRSGTCYRHINRLSYQELDLVGTPSLVTRMTSDINQATGRCEYGASSVSALSFYCTGSGDLWL